MPLFTFGPGLVLFCGSIRPDCRCLGLCWLSSLSASYSIALVWSTSILSIWAPVFSTSTAKFSSAPTSPPSTWPPISQTDWK